MLYRLRRVMDLLSDIAWVILGGVADELADGSDAEVMPEPRVTRYLVAWRPLTDSRVLLDVFGSAGWLDWADCDDLDLIIQNEMRSRDWLYYGQEVHRHG